MIVVSIVFLENMYKMFMWNIFIDMREESDTDKTEMIRIKIGTHDACLLCLTLANANQISARFYSISFISRLI